MGDLETPFLNSYSPGFQLRGRCGIVSIAALESAAIIIRTILIVGALPAYLVFSEYCGIPGWLDLEGVILGLAIFIGGIEGLWFFFVQMVPGADALRQTLVWCAEMMALWLAFPLGVFHPYRYFAQAAFLGDMVLCRLLLIMRLKPQKTVGNNNAIVSAALERNTGALRILLGTHRHPRHPDCELQLLGRQLNRVCCPRSSFLEQENAVFYANQLIDARALVDYPDTEGRSALQHAAEHGWPYLASVLLRAGADIEHPDHNRHTALHIAAWHGRFDMVDFLISQNANVSALDEYGNTPFMVAHEHVGMTRDFCNCQTSGYMQSVPMETDKTCCSPYYEELWKLEATRDDLARVVGLGERRHFVNVYQNGYGSSKVSCLTGEYELETEDNKTRIKFTTRLFNSFKTPYKGRNPATRFGSVLLFGPDGGCDLQQSRQETHSHSGSFADASNMVRFVSPANFDMPCHTLQELLPSPTYDQLWALQHSNDREVIASLSLAARNAVLIDAWRSPSGIKDLILRCSKDQLSPDERQRLEKLLSVTGGSPAISSGRKLRRKRQASSVFWAILEKGLKARLILIVFAYLFFFTLLYNVEIIATDPASCLKHINDDDYWDDHDCVATENNWHYEKDLADMRGLFTFSVCIFMPYLIYFACRAVNTYLEAMAGRVPWKKLSRLLETDEQLPTVPLCDHPVDPRWAYRAEFDETLAEAVNIARGLGDSGLTAEILSLGAKVKVKKTAEIGVVVRIDDSDPSCMYKIQLVHSEDWFAQDAVIAYTEDGNSSSAVSELHALETTGLADWRQYTFHEKIPWLEEMDSKRAYFALLECGAIRDEEDFCTLVQQGISPLFDRAFPQDFCDAMEFWRNIYKVWLLAHSERMIATFEAFLKLHLPGAELGPRKAYGRIRLKELHHRTQSMRDVEDHHLDHMPSFDEMTIAAHVHDFLRARLLVETEADVVDVVKKIRGLNISADNCTLLRVENCFRPNEGHFTREVRMYILIRKNADEQGMSAVAEIQIRQKHEEAFWERVHIIERARRGDYH